MLLGRRHWQIEPAGRIWIALNLCLIAPAGLAQARPIASLTDANFPQFLLAKIDLEQVQFWDKLLQGNRSIACVSWLGADRKQDAAGCPEQHSSALERWRDWIYGNVCRWAGHWARSPWKTIAKRIAAIPAYANRFKAVYPEISAGLAIGFTNISNAIAAYTTFDFRSDTAPLMSICVATAALEPAVEVGQVLFMTRRDALAAVLAPC